MKIHTKIIASAILIAGLGSGSYYTYNEFNKLEDKNKKLTDQVNSLSEAVVNKDKLIIVYKEEVDILRTSNKKLTDEVGKLNTNIKEKEESINSLKLRLEKAMTDGESPIQQSNVIKTITVEASAYTALDGSQIGITKTGYDVRNTIYINGYRIIASDPSVIPLYSLVKVYPKTGKPFTAIVADTGSAIKKFKIDVLVASKSEAKQFGRQKGVKVEILRYGKGE